jgi:tellurite resistance protein TehA-like permease
MNTILFFLLEVILTLSISMLVFRYLRPFLTRILVDLCRTEERAQFWTVFSNIILVGLPLLIALTYQPEATKSEELFFEITHRISGNMLGFLFALLGIGFIVSFFALVAPRQKESQ